MEKHEKGNQTDEQQAKKPCEECQKKRVDRLAEDYLRDPSLRSEEEAYARHLAVASGYFFEMARIRTELKAIKGLVLSCYLMLVLIFALLMSQKD